MQFRLAGQKGLDATASRPPNRRYSKLHFILESAKKIDNLSTQITENNTKSHDQIKIQADALRQSLADIKNINDQISNITYKPGYIAKLEIPKSIEKSIENIESILNTPSEWGNGEEIPNKLNDEFTTLINPLPSWQIEELKPRLYAARWAINSLQMINQQEAKDLDTLAKQLDEIKQQLEGKPDGLYEDLADSLSKLNQKYMADGLALATKSANELLESNSQDANRLDKSIEYLSKFSDSNEDENLKKLTTSLSQQYNIIDISAKVDDIVSNLKNIEKTNQNDLIQASMYQAEQNLDELKLGAFKENLLSNQTLEEEFHKLNDQINSERLIIEKNIENANNEKVKKYQVWALNQIQNIKTLDKLKEENIKSIDSFIDRHNPDSDAYKQAVKKSQDDLADEMVKYLSPINTNLLDNAVAQWFQTIYTKRYDKLDDEHQLEVVEQFAVATKKGLE